MEVLSHDKTSIALVASVTSVVFLEDAPSAYYTDFRPSPEFPAPQLERTRASDVAALLYGGFIICLQASDR